MVVVAQGEYLELVSCVLAHKTQLTLTTKQKKNTLDHPRIVGLRIGSTLRDVTRSIIGLILLLHIACILHRQTRCAKHYAQEPVSYLMLIDEFHYEIRMAIMSAV